MLIFWKSEPHYAYRRYAYRITLYLVFIKLPCNQGRRSKIQVTLLFKFSNKLAILGKPEFVKVVILCACLP